MAGGFGRAQGGYDEMVFRAMVRDNAHFYAPLGLESEGTRVDFQVGVNDYLYGTRFFSYLGLIYGAREGDRLAAARRGQRRRYYAAQFERVFGKPLDDGLAATGSPGSTPSSRPTSQSVQALSR